MPTAWTTRSYNLDTEDLSSDKAKGVLYGEFVEELLC